MPSLVGSERCIRDIYHLENSCKISTKPKAVLNLFGITEIQENSNFLDDTKFFSASNYIKTWLPEKLDLENMSKKLSPIYLVGSNPPRVLTIHGTNDSWVPYDQAIRLDKILKDKHGHKQLHWFLEKIPTKVSLLSFYGPCLLSFFEGGLLPCKVGPEGPMYQVNIVEKSHSTRLGQVGHLLNRQRNKQAR